MSDESEDEGVVYGSLENRNIGRVRFGTFEFDTWYANSVYFLPNEPEMLAWKAINSNVKISASNKKTKEFIDQQRMWIKTLFVCDSCFKYTEEEEVMKSHMACCRYKTTLPGKIMYHDGKYTIRKIKGSKHQLFCQCMCLFAKFFLDNKSVFFDLDYFDFYVVFGEIYGQQVPMGFFSKELLSWDANNLACICVFPPFQRRGLGNLLISFSYELSKAEGKVSGPEHPLSPFGKMGYLNYWTKTLCREFLAGCLSTLHEVTLELISNKTGFRVDDLLMALDYMGVVYEKGTKDIYKDYYKSDSDYLFFENDCYKVIIVKSKIKQWAIDHNIDFEPTINIKSLMLY